MASRQASLFTHPVTDRNYGRNVIANARAAEGMVREFSERLGVEPPKMKISYRVYPAGAIEDDLAMHFSCAFLRTADRGDLGGLIGHEMGHVKRKHVQKGWKIEAVAEVLEAATIVAAAFVGSLELLAGAVLAKNVALGAIGARMEKEANEVCGELGELNNYYITAKYNCLHKEPHALRDAVGLFASQPSLLLTGFLVWLHERKEMKKV